MTHLFSNLFVFWFDFLSTAPQKIIHYYSVASAFYQFLDLCADQQHSMVAIESSWRNTQHLSFEMLKYTWYRSTIHVVAHSNPTLDGVKSWMLGFCRTILIQTQNPAQSMSILTCIFCTLGSRMYVLSITFPCSPPSLPPPTPSPPSPKSPLPSIGKSWELYWELSHNTYFLLHWRNFHMIDCHQGISSSDTAFSSCIQLYLLRVHVDAKPSKHANYPVMGVFLQDKASQHVLFIASQ